MNTVTRILSVVLAGLHVFSGACLFAGSARLSSDFSPTANPQAQSPWRLGYKERLDGPFSIYREQYFGRADDSLFAYWGARSHSESWIRQNLGPSEPSVPGQGTFPLLGISATPGYSANTDNYVCVRYPIRISGNYRVWMSGRATGLRDVDVRVHHGKVELFGQNVDPNVGVGVTNELFCTSGSSIDVTIGRGDDRSNFGAVFQFDVGVDSPQETGVANAELSFDPLETDFILPVDVEIFSSATTGLGAIRYTLDGSEPTANSSLYTRPIRLDQTAEVRARMFGLDGVTSPTFSKTYRRDGAGVGNPTYTRFVDGLSAQFSAVSNSMAGWSLGYKSQAEGRFKLYESRFPGTAYGNTLSYWGMQPNTESFIRQNQGPNEFSV